MKYFYKLEQICNDYKTAIDALGVEYERESRYDAQYNENVQNKRRQDRNSVYDAKIVELAKEAKTAAAPEIAKLRAALQEYVTTSVDPATLQTLQTLLAAGTPLTGAEINAFEAAGGYAVLRLLEGPSNGHIQAPRLDAMERDLIDLTGFFGRLDAYRGTMGDTNPGTPFGQSGGVGSVIMAGQIDGFPARLAEMSARWAVMGDI